MESAAQDRSTKAGPAVLEVHDDICLRIWALPDFLQPGRGPPW